MYGRFTNVCMCPRYLALSYLQTALPNTLISHLFPLFMRFLEWLVTSFSSSFYLCISMYLLRWWCIVIVFKMVSIRWSANVRYHFESYKTRYKPIFLYIVYILYIGTFNVAKIIFCTCITIYLVMVCIFMS